MIGILGKMRIIVLVVLLAVNGILGAQIYTSIKPQQEKVERDIRISRSNVSRLTNDIDQLLVGFDVLINQQTQYKELESDGFFGNQSRYEAGRLFEKIQEDSGVLSAKAKIKGGETKETEQSIKAGHRILQSGISIEIEAIEDTDIFYYLSLLESKMPGHIAIERINMERVGEVNGEALKAISSGESPPMVKANIEAKWTTMIPESFVIEQEGGN